MKSLKAKSYLKNALSVIPTKQKCISIQVMTFEMCVCTHADRIGSLK